MNLIWIEEYSDKWGILKDKVGEWSYKQMNWFIYGGNKWYMNEFRNMIMNWMIFSMGKGNYRIRNWNKDYQDELGIVRDK